MKTFLGITLASILLAGSANAALPPLWQGVNEVKAILEDQQLSNALPSGDVLIKIVKKPDGYLLITNKRKVLVKIIPQESAMPGPTKFKLEFGEVKVKRDDGLDD